MKKLFLLLVLAMLVVGCGKKEDENKLYLFNWSDYIPQEVVEGFQKETGIEVVSDYYASNEEMYSKIRSGGGGYDIIVPSTDYAEIMIKQGLVDKIDKSKVPNIKYINKDIMKKVTFDKDGDYIVPYAIGATGIAVDKRVVGDNYEHSFDIFLRKDLKGKMTLLDDMREVLGSALLVEGYDSRTDNVEEIKKAGELVSKWKENIVKFDSDSFGKGLVNGEYAVVHGYYENIAAQLDDENAKYFDFFIPEKGGNMYIDSMMVLKDAKNKENAYKFMDYIHRPEVYKEIIDYLQTPSVNTEAAKIRETKPSYTVEDLKETSPILDLGEAIVPQSNEWNELLIK